MKQKMILLGVRPLLHSSHDRLRLHFDPLKRCFVSFLLRYSHQFYRFKHMIDYFGYLKKRIYNNIIFESSWLLELCICFLPIVNDSINSKFFEIFHDFWIVLIIRPAKQNLASILNQFNLRWVSLNIFDSPRVESPWSFTSAGDMFFSLLTNQSCTGSFLITFHF